MGTLRRASIRIAAILLAPALSAAQEYIPEPDIIYFGAAPVGEVVQVERGVNRPVDSEVLAANAAGPSGYAVRVKLVQPVTTPTPATPPTGKAYLGNRATVFVNGVAQGQVILDERGQIYQLDFPNPARTASPNAVLTPVRLVPSVPQPPSCGAVTCTATSTRTATPTPTITQTPTITATPTPTSTGAIVDGAVTLQGRPPTPDPRWQVPLRVSLTRQGEPTPFLQLTPSTDATGHFRLDGLDPGTYEIRVKNPKTLQVKQTVTLASGVTGVTFGILRAGDANDDNVVSLIDFSILRTTFGLTVGQPGYDGRADFNDNQTVNVLDFSLMRPNFSQLGAALQYRVPAAAAAETRAPVATPTAAAVQLRVVAPTTDIEVGATFMVAVEVRSGGQPVDGAAAYLDYDASVLEAVSLEPGSALPQVLQSDRMTAGQVNYAAGTFEGFPSGTFTLLTVTFRAIAEPVGTQIAVAEALGRQTDVTYGGESILTCRAGATVGFGSAEPVVGTPGSSEGTPAVVLATATAAAPEPESPTPTPTVTPAGGGNAAAVDDETAATSSGCSIRSGDSSGGGLVLLGLLALLWGRRR